MKVRINERETQLVSHIGISFVIFSNNDVHGIPASRCGADGGDGATTVTTISMPNMRAKTT